MVCESISNSSKKLETLFLFALNPAYQRRISHSTICEVDEERLRQLVLQRLPYRREREIYFILVMALLGSLAGICSRRSRLPISRPARHLLHSPASAVIRRQLATIVAEM